MRRRGGISASFVATAVVCVLSTPLFAQTAEAPALPQSGTTLLAGSIELARLVDLAAAQNGVSVEYDASVLKGTVTLRLDGSIDAEALWSLMNRVLSQRGFTTVRLTLSATTGRTPGSAAAQDQEPEAASPAADRDTRSTRSPVYSIVRLQDAASLVAPVAAMTDVADATAERGLGMDAAAINPDEFVRTRTLFPGEERDAAPTPGFAGVIVRVRHIPTRNAVDSAMRVLSKPGGAATALTGGGVDASESGDRSGGLVLLADLTPRLERALELLAVIDRPGTATVIEETVPRYLPAQQLAALAMQVAAKRDAVWGGGTAATGSGSVSEKTPGEVMASPDGTSVLIVSPRDSVDWWKSLIERLDKREPVSVATYRPRHFPAADVANLIEQTVRDVGAGPAGTGGGTGPSTGGGGRDDRWKVVMDDLTGSLIVTATPAQHAAISELVSRLDATPAAARRPVRSFVIKNRSVSEVRSILDELIQAGVLEAGVESPGSPGSGLDGASGASVQITPFPPPPQPDPILSGADAGGSARLAGAAGAGLSGTNAGGRDSGDARRRLAQRDGSPELVLTIDEGTNTLIAVGEPRLLAQIESLLPTIDVRQPQVMLEVLLVTLSEAQTMDLGVELEQLIISGDVRIRLSSLFGLGMRGANGDRVGPDNANGFTGVVLSPGDFSVIIRALQTLNNGRSVSMPKLLVGNNQNATINSVLQQPFASVNASNTVSTTSFGGTQDAGTVVTIRPQIAEGDHLVMDYSVSLSTFVGSSSSATLPPPRQQNQVRSVATIPDGYTVVVGGIELETDSKSVSQVPLLGDIPVIGEAFKTRSKSGTRSKFYVFIRANVLRGRGFEDLKFLSSRDAQAARVDDGFPEVRARVIR